VTKGFGDALFSISSNQVAWYSITKQNDQSLFRFCLLPQGWHTLPSVVLRSAPRLSSTGRTFRGNPGPPRLNKYVEEMQDLSSPLLSLLLLSGSGQAKSQKRGLGSTARRASSLGSPQGTPAGMVPLGHGPADRGMRRGRRSASSPRRARPLHWRKPQKGEERNFARLVKRKRI
jgi:hypothetical protein